VGSGHGSLPSVITCSLVRAGLSRPLRRYRRQCRAASAARTDSPGPATPRGVPRRAARYACGTTRPAAR
jgi:hypothetical protein